MATNIEPTETTALVARRETVGPNHAYEVSISESRLGAWLHLFESGHDAALHLAPGELVELRADIATALLRLGHGVTPSASGVRSVAGVSIVEHLRQVFAALVELDKLHPAEVDAIAALIVGHVRSWRPFVLREVSNG